MLVLRIFNGKDAVLSEAVTNPDHAALVADRLWVKFVDAGR